MFKGAFINMALIGFRVAPYLLFIDTQQGDYNADTSQ